MRHVGEACRLGVHVCGRHLAQGCKAALRRLRLPTIHCSLLVPRLPALLSWRVFPLSVSQFSLDLGCSRLPAPQAGPGLRPPRAPAARIQ